MAKKYELATDEVMKLIAWVRETYYLDILPVSVGSMFVSEEDGEQCLTHGGYPAAALCRIVPARDRAAGLTDAQIVIDRAVWNELTNKQRCALLDHELHHIELALDKDGAIRYDAQDRPKLKMRKHDRQMGWFDAVAQRHGEHSMEVRQAQLIIREAGQLYFDFGLDTAA